MLHVSARRLSAEHCRVVVGRIDVLHLGTRSVSGAKPRFILGDLNTRSEQCFVRKGFRGVPCEERKRPLSRSLWASSGDNVVAKSAWKPIQAYNGILASEE